MHRSGQSNAVVRRWLWRTLAKAGAVSLGLGLAAVAACSRQNAAAQSGPASAGPAAPVEVALAAAEDVPVDLKTIGTVQPIISVAVKAQVGGVLTEVHFSEGQHVKKGALLFVIDPRPYAAALHQAEGILARDSAQLQNAIKEADRTASLFQKQLASQEDFDSSRAGAEALKGLVQADRAALENARLQLEYCSIRSPLDGLAGQRMVDPGNVVKANDATLVIINQLKPIYVNFTAPQQQLPEILQYRAAGRLPVQALITGQDQPAEGELTFVDNQVNTTTGTILLRATFANADERLWPGQFVNVVLTLYTQKNAVVIPSRAVQTSQQGQYIFVVKPDLTAEMRPVTVSRTTDTWAVIAGGLKPEEKVVTDGQLRVVPGGKVEIKTNQSPAPAAKP